MSPKDFLLQEIRHSLYEKAWHGPALLEALGDVTAAEAAARPIPGVHTVWEITLHTIGWIEEAARRLQGGEPGDPRRGDWPAVENPGEAAWAATLQELEQAVQTLTQAVATFPEDRLDTPYGGLTHDPELGSGVSYRRLLSGLAQHNTYHAGQIILLRRAAGAVNS